MGQQVRRGVVPAFPNDCVDKLFSQQRSNDGSGAPHLFNVTGFVGRRDDVGGPSGKRIGRGVSGRRDLDQDRHSKGCPSVEHLADLQRAAWECADAGVAESKLKTDAG